MLDELSRSGWITLSGTSERPIGQVVNFRKHQRVDRPQVSRLKQYALADYSTNDRRTIDEPSTTEQGTGKGKETPIVPASGDDSADDKNFEPAEDDPSLIRAKAIFRMRPGTQLDRSQRRAWKLAASAVADTPDPDWIQLEAYYAADIPHRDDYRRRDLATLLNNWSGELTRAAAWAARTGFSAAQKSQKKEKQGPPDDIWRQALVELYPDSDPSVYATWAQVPDSLQAEILHLIALAEKEAA